MQKDAERIAAKYGGSVTPLSEFSLKQRSSIERKIKADGAKGDVTSIKDLARTTIIVPEDQIENVLSDLKGLKGHMRTKRQYEEDKFHGYTGNIVNVMYNGVPTEIQVNTAKMIYAKEQFKNAYNILGKEKMTQVWKETGQASGLGHKYYEAIRGDGNMKKARRGGAKRAKQDSKEYYGHFKSKKS